MFDSSPYPSYPFTYPSGSYNYNSIKICKQISTPPQPYQKIPDIYFLCSCSLPNFITIPSPVTIQFAVDVFVLYVILYLLLYCLLCYLVLRPQNWINSTTTTTHLCFSESMLSHNLANIGYIAVENVRKEMEVCGYFVHQTTQTNSLLPSLGWEITISQSAAMLCG